MSPPRWHCKCLVSVLLAFLAVPFILLEASCPDDARRKGSKGSQQPWSHQGPQCYSLTGTESSHVRELWCRDPLSALLWEDPSPDTWIVACERPWATTQPNHADSWHTEGIRWWMLVILCHKILGINLLCSYRQKTEFQNKSLWLSFLIFYFMCLQKSMYNECLRIPVIWGKVQK